MVFFYTHRLSQRLPPSPDQPHITKRKIETWEKYVLKSLVLSNLSSQTLHKSIRGRKTNCHRRWRVPREESPLNQLSKACLNIQRLKQQAECLHRSVKDHLHMYYRFQFSVFIRLWSEWTICFWVSWLLLRSFLSVGLLSPTTMWWFCYILLY